MNVKRYEGVAVSIQNTSDVLSYSQKFAREIDATRLAAVREIQRVFLTKSGLTTSEFCTCINALLVLVKNVSQFETRTRTPSGDLELLARFPNSQVNRMGDAARKWTIHMLCMELKGELVTEPDLGEVSAAEVASKQSFRSPKVWSKTRPLIPVNPTLHGAEVLDVFVPKSMGVSSELSTLPQYLSLTESIRSAFDRHDVETIEQLLSLGSDTPQLSLLYRIEQNLKPQFSRRKALAVVEWLVELGFAGRV